MEREKVIKGLECCSDAVSECGKNCPYYGIENCQSSMQADALTLLKAQEPRVIKVAKYDDEIQSPGMDCFTWIEEREREDVYIGTVNRTSHKNYGEETYSFMRFWGKSKDGIKFEDYGKTWRCWTSRPTDEQREVTPWN